MAGPGQEAHPEHAQWALQADPNVPVVTAAAAGTVLSSSLTGCDCLSAPARDNSRWRLSFDDSAVVADQLVFRFQVSALCPGRKGTAAQQVQAETVLHAAPTPGSQLAWSEAAHSRRALHPRPRPQVSTVLPHLCSEVAYRQGFCCNQTLDTISMSLRQEFWWEAPAALAALHSACLVARPQQQRCFAPSRLLTCHAHRPQVRRRD